MPNSSDFNSFVVNPTNIDIRRSLFNMNHSVKWSCNIGECIPFDCIEVVPGDTFSIDTSKVVRLQPLVAPIMDEVIMDCYWFFVPHRLVWNHFVNFMGENTDSAWTPTVEYQVPQLELPITGFDIGTIADYLGVPPKVRAYDPNDQTQPSHVTVNALPFRSYALICDQWFRAESLMDPVHVHVDDVTRVGVNTGDQITDIELGGKPFIASKFFDYFTSALPEPQRGESVPIPVVRTNNVVGFWPVVSQNPDARILASDGLNHYHPYHPGSYESSPRVNGVNVSYSPNNGSTISYIGNARDLGVAYSNNNNLRFDSGFTPTLGSEKVYFNNLWAQIPINMSNGTPIGTINDLRTAFAMQRYLERSARYGGRYQEFIKGFFSVDSPDARLQRSEYLGGSRLSLNINSVEQTSATQEGSTPLGDVAGMSVTADQNSDFTKSFTEHGYVIGICVCRYHHSYQNALNKMFSRKTKYDFYNPVFANLGEQSIDKSEIMLTDRVTLNSKVFGYQERWAEYRYLPSRVAGEMRSVANNSLDMWHLADYYEPEYDEELDYYNWPELFLSADWIREDKNNLDRCLAVTSDISNQVICDFYIECEASRPMPLHSIPGMVDHY